MFSKDEGFLCMEHEKNLFFNASSYIERVTHTEDLSMWVIRSSADEYEENLT